MKDLFENWSDFVFLGACVEAGMLSKEALWLLFCDAITSGLKAALRDPRNWKRVRIRRDAKTMAGARRVTRALRTAKPGQLVRL